MLLLTPSLKCLFLCTISQSSLQQLLLSLNVHKAHGPGCISLYTLKHWAEEIAPILHVIFNEV